MGRVRILKASAGSGKTFTLAYEYIKSVISEPSLYKEVLAVTFTNKATEEMKRRILMELYLLSKAKDSKYMPLLIKDTGFSTAKIQSQAVIAQSFILHNYSRFAVLTIDKFFQRIIRSFIKELGMDLNFNIELKTDTILDNSVDSLLDTIVHDKELRGWITDFVGEKINAGKSWDLKKSLISLGKEIFNDDFKNSPLSMGELEDFVGSIISKVSQVEQQLKSLAQRIKDLMDENNLTVDDFSGKSTGIMGYVSKVLKSGFVEPSKTALNILGGTSKWFTGKTHPVIEPLCGELTDILGDICDTYNDNKYLYFSSLLLKKNYRNFALLGKLSEHIKSIYANENILHISETNKILAELISGDDTPFIFEKVGNVFSEFMIDEFQDTSTKQWENFKPLLDNALSAKEKDAVLLVGDVKQSIYRFRGGDWSILNNKVEKEFSNSTTSSLQTNYRSLKNVVDFNNNFIGKVVELCNDDLNEMIGNKLPASSQDMLKNAYTDHAQKTFSDEKKGYVNITFNEVQDPESKPLVIERIEQLQERGYEPGDIAILVRTGNESKALASMLLQYKGEHPNSKYCYDVVTAEALQIGKSAQVNFIISFLKFSIDEKNLVERAIINKYLGRDFGAEFATEEQDLLKKLKTLSPLEAFEEIIGYYNIGNESKELAYVQALHNQILSYCSSNVCDSLSFLDYWQKHGREQSINIPASRSAITIISIHKSKGLEFKTVIMPFCNWGMTPLSQSITWCDYEDHEDMGKFPISWENKMEQSHFSKDFLDEKLLSYIDNINLLYVALTRAECELHIIVPGKAAKNQIDELVVRVLQGQDTRVKLDEIELNYSEKEPGFRVYEYGEPTFAHRQKASPRLVASTYASRKFNARENLRVNSQIKEEEDEKQVFAPRNYGILMHRIFENSSTSVEVLASVEQLRKDAIINEDESENLKKIIENSFKNPLIKEWFCTPWQQIKNENQIILPSTAKIKRPDRVMINQDRAVVVDYKFGLNESNSHKKQVREYVKILESMGYKSVEGYVWYVSKEKVEKV
ncbi:MAG: UvrD-helicase domain-containing protein [Rikenellaceae bacterium]